MLIHNDWQQLTPMDRTETSIPATGEVPQLPRLLCFYGLQPKPPSQSPQMRFHHWKGTWDTGRTCKEDGKDQPVPLVPLQTEVLGGTSMTSLVGSPEGNQTNARADFQHFTKKEFIQNRGLPTPFLAPSYKGKAAKSPFILAPSFSLCNVVSHPKGEMTQDYPSWVKHCAGSTCILCPVPTAPCLGTLLSPDKEPPAQHLVAILPSEPWGLTHSTSTWPATTAEIKPPPFRKRVISKD